MKVILPIISVLFASILVAQTYPNEKALENGWEQWQDKVQESGNVRVGLMLDQEDDHLNPVVFYVVIPETEITNLCVALRSKDGHYAANLNYNISELPSGMQQFVFPTKYKSEIEAYGAREMVILATLSKDCNTSPETYLVSGWSHESSSHSISVYVNSLVPASVVLVKKDSSQLVFKCETLEIPKGAYYKKCQIPFEDYNGALSLLVRESLKRRSKTNFKDHKMPVKPIKFE